MVYFRTMKIIDQRTSEQKKTHRWAVVAKDKSLSSWGGAAGGASRCAWVIPGERINFKAMEKLEQWVRNRKEMQYVSVVNLDYYRPRHGTAHFQIYVVDENHPGVNY